MDLDQRSCVIIGNWKMYKSIDEGRDFVRQLIPLIQTTPAEVGLAVSFTAIQPLAQAAENSPLMIGAQNMNDATEGAFTGEVAAKMLLEAGARFVLLGHSERRHLYHEDNAFIHRKLKRAIEAGLQPVLCIGETQAEREAGQTEAVLEQQLKGCLDAIDPADLNQLIIAYEPVWAIGTGLSATPAIAQEAHVFCRQILMDLLGEAQAEHTVIQYGGSVNPANAYQLLSQKDIDGLLIGGASLSLENFAQIVNNIPK